ncbi:MAG: hypothetical protein Tsb0014_35900 [Pleurocapsa sp.]
MLNRIYAFSKSILSTSLLTACVSTIYISPASSQVLPSVWGTVGSVDDLVSYGVGARFLGTGIEIGTGEEGATGGDFLTFISFPVVSPYVGIGFYSGDETIAYSGGVHISPFKRFLFGAGYHSIRGVTGQIGFKI